MAERSSAIFWVLCPKQSLHCYRNSFRLDNFHLGMVKVQYLRCGYAIEQCPVFWSAIRQTLVMSIRIQSQLWNRFPEIFGARKIDFLTADREFVGEDWFDYLLCDPCNHFRIRIRKNTLLDDRQK